MRLFVGIPIPELVTHKLSALSVGLQSNGDGLRWSAPESWHVTLRFLGNTRADQYACIVRQLSGLRAHSLPIQINALGFFDRVGIFFAGVELTPELLRLQQAVTAATSPCGFDPDTRPYHPHVTLARSKGRRRTNALAELQAKIRRQPMLGRFIADAFVLYESVTTPSGARYEVREHFPMEAFTL